MVNMTLIGKRAVGNRLGVWASGKEGWSHCQRLSSRYGQGKVGLFVLLFT